MAATFETSRTLLETSRSYLAGGVASTLRAAMKPVPLFAASASGSRLSDADGNSYIDYLLAYGPLILGHAHPEVTGSVHKALQQGATYGLQHQGEFELARQLTELLPSADMVALSGSGTEAVMLALRLARAYTGKSKIVRFHGHYHGWSDTIFTSFPSADMKQSGVAAGEGAAPGTGGQSEPALAEIILLPWNRPDVLEQTLREHGDDIAAVITEPVMCNSGCLVPLPGYLQLMRDLTEQLGIVLIFDEVITGFRLGAGGAQGRFGIVPDLTTIGKALGSGMAISAVGGRRPLMELIAQGKVGHLGTLNGNCAAIAAALATIRVLGEQEGQRYQTMEQTTLQLVDGIRQRLTAHRIPGTINQIGPVFHWMFTEQAEVKDFQAFQQRDAAKYALFAELLLEEGVLVRASGLWYVSAAHTQEDVAATLQAIDSALSRLAAVTR